MKYDEEGNVIISLEDIIQNMSKEEKKKLCKTISIDYDVKKAVIDYICDEDEDGWWCSDSGHIREDILMRIEKAQLDKPTWYNWKLIDEAITRLKHMRSENHIYYTLYHLRDPHMLVSDFVRIYLKDESEHMTNRADDDIKEVLNIVKNAIKLK